MIATGRRFSAAARGAAAMGMVFAAAVYAAPPENLARRAAATATSEHNSHYLARFAVDGRIPPAGGRSRDLDAAWCVLKRRSGDRAEFTLQWPEPTTIAQLVYFGRTSWYVSECWKDYEVYADDDPEPIARGTFRMMHGPQPVDLPARAVSRLTFRFLNSYGGPNPGAAEIMAFGRRLSDAELDELAAACGAAPPRVDRVNVASLRRLILRLKEEHGARYAQAAAHMQRLAELERAPEDQRRRDELARLQRDVLLFDVQKLLVVKRHEITASHVYTYHYEGQRDGGGLYVFDLERPEQPPRELIASPDGEILDCDLSYDGRTVLFSWRAAPGEGYHIWRINIDGAGRRRLTNGPWHDYNACWLPDGGVAFLSTRRPQFAYCWHAPVGVLHRMEADGSRVRLLSANYLNDFTPSVLDDGRIIYSRWEYVDRPAIPIQSLWTINPDGTNLAGYFGNRVISPGTFMEARQIPGTNKIVCTMTGHNGPTRGAIGVIDRGRGVNAQAAITNITPDTPVPPVDQGNGNTSGPKPYSSPYPLDRHRLLVSARGPVLVRDFAGTCVATVLPAPSDGMQYFNAQPVRPRRRPPVIPSKLPPDPQEDTATLFVQNVYRGLLPHVRPGEVAAIRVVREMEKTVRIDPKLRAFGFQFPVISCGATYAGKEVLGETPVEEDGSAHFVVPAREPIYFMVLDRQGRALQRMRSFTHLMPGEAQGCIGCHENRVESPPPADALAARRPPRELEPPEWGSGGFDYARIVQPVLDRHCVRCHDAYDPAGIDLTGDQTDYFNVSYDVLARQNQGPQGSPYVSWIPTYNGQEANILQITPKSWGSPQSRLAQLVLDGHPDAKGRPRVRLARWEQRRILAWIDLNVPYYGTSETAYPEALGCRRIYPPRLDDVLADVARRRCAACHAEGKIPRRVWTRITRPELNNFLLAPLSRQAGGTERCGTAVFRDRTDPDYQAVLATFDEVLDQLVRRPRMDMPGARPAADVNRSCQ